MFEGGELGEVGDAGWAGVIKVSREGEVSRGGVKRGTAVVG